MSKSKGTGIGKPIAGLVGGLMPDPTADVDAQLRAEGFDLGEEKSLEDKYYEGQDLYQKEVEAIGYTFDFGLDNEPTNLRKK